MYEGKARNNRPLVPHTPPPMRASGDYYVPQIPDPESGESYYKGNSQKNPFITMLIGAAVLIVFIAFICLLGLIVKYVFNISDDFGSVFDAGMMTFFGLITIIFMCYQTGDIIRN